MSADPKQTVKNKKKNNTIRELVDSTNRILLTLSLQGRHISRGRISDENINDREATDG